MSPFFEHRILGAGLRWVFLERMRQVQIADVLDRPLQMKSEKVADLLAKRSISKNESTNISLAFIIHDQETSAG